MTGASDPSELIERPSWDEADEAIGMAEDALSVVRADLASSGWTE